MTTKVLSSRPRINAARPIIIIIIMKREEREREREGEREGGREGGRERERDRHKDKERERERDSLLSPTQRCISEPLLQYSV